MKDGKLELEILKEYVKNKIINKAIKEFREQRD